jgi:hypothetical protein
MSATRRLALVLYVSDRAAVDKVVGRRQFPSPAFRRPTDSEFFGPHLVRQNFAET